MLSLSKHLYRFVRFSLSTMSRIKSGQGAGGEVPV